ncbi:MAG: Ribosomal RNA small subunit methyltransferase I [Chlamydiae bacterium]|nr:Ribosomal RNA small subunit methyltransferase I [Chlamydiota bacterium]
MLYLVATPIGNLKDFTFRAQEVLSGVDYILCEDTRHSRHLLSHYSIDRPLKSYHKFSEASREAEIIQDLKEGMNIALITDAGMPAVADPGERLVARCIEEKLPYTLIPGASAPLMALVLSGFPGAPFQFIGFLPKKEGEHRKAVIDALHYSGVTLCFESPHRIHKTLEALEKFAPTRPLALCRELTKRYESCVRGAASELLKNSYKGEITLVIGPAPAPDYSHLSGEEHVALLQETFGLTKQEALKLAAKMRGVAKKELYF